MYWKGYSWSLLGSLIMIWTIKLDRSPELIFSWLNRLMASLWLFGLSVIFGFAYGVKPFRSTFSKYIFWMFMVHLVVGVWVCSIPDVWTIRSTGIFIVVEMLTIMSHFPLYLALYWSAYAHKESPRNISEEVRTNVS